MLNQLLPFNGFWILVTVAAATAGYILVFLLLKKYLPGLTQRIAGLPLLGGLVEQEDALLTGALVVLGALFLASTGLISLSLAGVETAPATSRLAAFGLDLGRWLVTNGLRILVVIVLTYLIQRGAGRALQPVIRTALTRGKEGIELEEAGKRANALGQVAQYGVTTVAYVIALIMIISELGFNLAPILAGVGIAGIALGFGAQNLVRDVIAGVFVLLEDQYRVGDVASVGGKTGLVEGVSLRRTILRDLDGIVHVVPNGEISVASNFTKSFSRVNLDVTVAYKEDLNHVFRVLNRVGMELSQDQYFGPLILEPPQVVRVNSFDASGIAVKILGVTRPIRQWEVMGELRRRIKDEFDRERIEIPFPHQTIYWGVESHPRAEPGEYTRGVKFRSLDETVDLALGTRDPWVRQNTESPDGVAVSGQEGVEGRIVPNLIAHLDQVRGLLSVPPLALFTDIDGTLANIAPNPKIAKLPPAVREALNYISQRHTVAVLTGRDAASAQAFLGLSSVTYHGNHGLEVWERGSASALPEAQPFKRQIQRLHRVARAKLSTSPGIVVENKGLSLALHYRQAPDPIAARQLLLDFLAEVEEAQSLIIYEGKMVVEAHADLPLNKGTSMRKVVEGRGIRSALVLGDDNTDLDSFRMLAQLREEGLIKGISVAVTGSNTPSSLLAASDYYLTDVESVEIFLTWLAEELQRTGQPGG